MDILMPVSSTTDLDTMIRLGMKEGYIGFLDRRWSHRFGDTAQLNRMYGFKERANFKNMDRMLKTISDYSDRISFFVTLNSNSYTQSESDYIVKICEELEDSGISGFIIGEPTLIKRLCESGYPVVVSTIAGVHNRLTAQYYKDMGVKRIILPRELSLNEIKSITQHVPMEYEVFIMKNGCRYCDSSCLCMHGNGYRSLCYDINNSPHKFIKHGYGGNDDNIIRNSDLFHFEFHNDACGLCSIFELMEMGISACKIVGRADKDVLIQECCKLVYDNIRIAEKCRSKEEYLEKMIMPNHENMCAHGFQCYYPESRF